jgi:hypothetical protein
MSVRIEKPVGEASLTGFFYAQNLDAAGGKR